MIFVTTPAVPSRLHNEISQSLQRSQGLELFSGQTHLPSGDGCPRSWVPPTAPFGDSYFGGLELRTFWSPLSNKRCISAHPEGSAEPV